KSSRQKPPPPVLPRSSSAGAASLFAVRSTNRIFPDLRRLFESANPAIQTSVRLLLVLVGTRCCRRYREPALRWIALYKQSQAAAGDQVLSRGDSELAVRCFS